MAHPLPIPPETATRLFEPRILVPPTEAGMRHRRNAYPSSYPGRQLWRLGWSLLTAAELGELLLLWDEVKGGVLRFDWTPPGKPPGQARFVEQIRWEGQGPNRFGVQAIVEEMR